MDECSGRVAKSVRRPNTDYRIPNTETMELGIYTFVERATHLPGEQRMRNLMEELALADQVGLDVFGIGEHHRPDYMVSTPAVVLAAASQRTKRIRLTSAVTVLSSDDPVR